jgi:dolichol-phosphate mannosyltransferase
MSDLATPIVVIPTYNEADNIRTVIDRVRSAAPSVTILVVDDNSPDGTGDLVRGHPDHLHQVFLLPHGQKAGLGAAYRAGFRWALDGGYDAVVQMDADLSHPPERIAALLSALDTADVAIGSRYVTGGGITQWTWSRRLISRAGNAFVRAVLGLPVHDTTAGFKAFRREALEQIAATESTSDGYCFQVENTWRASRLALRVVEVPITFTDRALGTSKMSGGIVLEAVLRVLAWRWREIWPAATQGTAPPAPSRGVAPRRGPAGAVSPLAPAAPRGAAS